MDRKRLIVAAVAVLALGAPDFGAFAQQGGVGNDLVPQGGAGTGVRGRPQGAQPGDVPGAQPGANRPRLGQGGGDADALPGRRRKPEGADDAQPAARPPRVGDDGGDAAPGRRRKPGLADDAQPGARPPRVGDDGGDADAVPGRRRKPGLADDAQPGARPPRVGDDGGDAAPGRRRRPGVAEDGQPDAPQGDDVDRPGRRRGGRPPRIADEEQGRFRDAFRGVRIIEEAAEGIPLTIGRAVPRRIRLRRLPPAIVALYPDYRGYRFFVSRNSIVVVDPDTFEIVDVIRA